MTFITIQTQIEVSTAVLGDVAITAAEGGIGHWAQILSYRPSRWTASGDDIAQDNIEVDEDFVFYEIVETEPSGLLDAVPVSINITPALLARGLGLLMRSTFIDDIGGMDAAMADAVVQYGVFGEQVFA